MFELNEAVSGRLIGPKSWNHVVLIFLKPKWVDRDSVCTVWVVWVVNCVICEINHVLVCFRSEMAVGSGFTK